MDLTDTWVNFYKYGTKRDEARRKKEPPVESACGLCGATVVEDDDFNVYSTAPEVRARRAADPLQPFQFPDGTVADDEIVCLPCLRAHLPALAQWVTDYGTLRAQRAALIVDVHQNEGTRS